MKRASPRPNWENPTLEQSKAFEEQKERLVIPLILDVPMAGRPSMIETDARMHDLGAVLLQQKDE